MTKFCPGSSSATSGTLKLIAKKELARLVVDSNVQEKAISPSTVKSV